MISHGVEISIAGGGADEKDGRKYGALLFFSFFFLYHIFVVKVQEIAWSASYGENKTHKEIWGFFFFFFLFFFYSCIRC